MKNPHFISTIAALIVTTIAASALAVGAYMTHPARCSAMLQAPVGNDSVRTQPITQQLVVAEGRMAELPQVKVQSTDGSEATFFGISID